MSRCFIQARPIHFVREWYLRSQTINLHVTIKNVLLNDLINYFTYKYLKHNLPQFFLWPSWQLMTHGWQASPMFLVTLGEFFRSCRENKWPELIFFWPVVFYLHFLCKIKYFAIWDQIFCLMTKYATTLCVLQKIVPCCLD